MMLHHRIAQTLTNIFFRSASRLLLPPADIGGNVGDDRRDPSAFRCTFSTSIMNLIPVLVKYPSQVTGRGRSAYYLTIISFCLASIINHPCSPYTSHRSSTSHSNPIHMPFAAVAPGALHLTAPP